MSQPVRSVAQAFAILRLLADGDGLTLSEIGRALDLSPSSCFNLLNTLVAEGAIDGIEVHHPRNSPEDRAECAELCKKHDLIVTGGSDFHGANHGKPHPVGACVTEDDQIARIEALARKRRGGAL